MPMFRKPLFWGMVAALIGAIALAGCTSIDTAVTGPVVSGKLQGKETTSYIPFSSTAGNPVIATEAFATPGLPTVVTSALNPKKYQDGDYFILFGANANVVIPKTADTKAAGVPNGSRFILHGYRVGGTNTIGYSGSTCYSVNNGGCPTSIAFGEAWVYIVDQPGGVWRAYPIGDATRAWATANFATQAAIANFTTKTYVDSKTLTPNAITAIKALTPSSTLAEVIAALQKQ